MEIDTHARIRSNIWGRTARTCAHLSSPRAHGSQMLPRATRCACTPMQACVRAAQVRAGIKVRDRARVRDRAHVPDLARVPDHARVRVEHARVRGMGILLSLNAWSLARRLHT
eukprot:3065571-Pleurochrysis_carterae.AAC.1